MNSWSGLLLASILVACAGGDDSGFPAEREGAGAGGSAAGSTGVAGESGTSGQGGASAGTSAGSDSGPGGAGATAGTSAGGGAGGAAAGAGGAGGSGEGCDALAQTGCAGDKACYPETTGTRCLSPGSVKEGEACTFANACSPGLTCLTTGDQTLCRKLCDPDATTGCAAGQLCLPVKNQTYAICVVDN